jgi:hypothetical protein
MRKALTVFGILGVLALGTATLFDRVDAAFGTCTYRCICSVPHKCCTTNGVTTCKPAPDGPLQCTQGYNC